MSWHFFIETTQRARKEYQCQASEWITATLCERDWEDFTDSEQICLKIAQSEGWRILPGQLYTKLKGQWEGEWATFRARPEIDAICKKYEIYAE